MAIQTVVLGPFNSISLVLGDQYNLVAGGAGNYYFSVLNTGNGNIAISNANTVALSDPASYMLPPNLSFSPLAWGPSGIWVAAGAAELISVALIPQ